MKVLVGMSGGVQSLVTAWLLKRQGMQVRGVHFDFTDSETARAQIQSIEKKIGISIQVVPFSEKLIEKLIEWRTIAEDAGQTLDLKAKIHPEFLFPHLFELMKHHQFSRVATGHQVLLQEDQLSKTVRVFQSEGLIHDESSLLLGLSQAELGTLILPLGSIPESMIQKLVQEVGGASDFNDELPELSPSSSLGFSVYLNTGIHLGLNKNPELVPGQLFENPDQPGKGYRVLDLDYSQKRIIVGEQVSLQISELHFEDCHWFGKGDLKLASLTCGMRTKHRSKPLPIQLIQFEGNRLKGFLNQPLQGEEVNIFKGETVLWIEGTEILGGGKVFKTR